MSHPAGLIVAAGPGGSSGGGGDSGPSGAAHRKHPKEQLKFQAALQVRFCMYNFNGKKGGKGWPTVKYKYKFCAGKFQNAYFTPNG